MPDRICIVMVDFNQRNKMDRIKKNFGFGMMRLPLEDKNINYGETSEMVDAFLGAGFNP